MRFYHILHLSLIEDLTGIFSAPPQSFRKEMEIFMYIYEEYLLNLSYF